ncbi:MAG: site-2 protease family protein [Planctomycetes bacterium]|nr:site-2 protease family protein [Planctomycetota bacterium]
MNLTAQDWRMIGGGFLVLVVSEVLHEMLKSRVADKLGDPTPRAAGQVTWNPMVFIDPIGTLLMPAIVLIGTKGQIILGGARPTRIQEERMRFPRLGGLLVHGVGPLANLGIAIFCALLYKALLRYAELPERSFPAVLLVQGVALNCLLVVWHYLPVPGSNGGNMIRALLPPAGKAFMDRLQSFVFPAFLLVIVLQPRWLNGLFGLMSDLRYWVRGL